MRFIDFIDHRFQEITVSVQEGTFSVSKDGESNALQSVLWVYRQIVKLLFIPKVLIHFLGVQIGLVKPPQPALERLKNEYQAQQQAQADAAKLLDLQKKGKKVGFHLTQLPGGTQNEPA